MLRFTDFAHLPEIDGLVQELIAEQSGLIVVAGLDSRPALEATTGPMPTFLAKVQADVERQFNEWWQSAQEELARTVETEINRLLGQLCGAAGLPAVVAGSLALARRRRRTSGG